MVGSNRELAKFAIADGVYLFIKRGARIIV